MRQAEPKREAAIVLFRLPTRGFPAVNLKFSSSPVPCVQTLPLSFDSTRFDCVCSVLSHSPKRKSSSSLRHCRRLLCSHPSLFYLQCVLLLFAPRVLFFAPSLFSLSPSDNDPGLIRLSLAKIMGLSCLCTVSVPFSHTQIHYCLPCFSCQASCGRCDQG